MQLITFLPHQVKTWFQNRRMKHKKHLRKQNTDSTCEIVDESDEKESSEYGELQEGDEGHDDDMEEIIQDKVEDIEGNQHKHAMVISPNKAAENPSEGMYMQLIFIYKMKLFLPMAT